ncbi:coiled-coil domain-containing protein [Flavobacterium foetidum]|uniref:hypothetical protein n=1 Tax=Flavobacterium foetidum TaxID=2026681 RepID=UPI00107567DC|nr:hypothetical protein [Flavobacterium foetidum]KAF2515278.1 hypothetical protein E0W73_10095 [Flavobacterium foetidum]
MKNKSFISTIILCWWLTSTLCLNAQTLGQDADGNSTIVVPAAAFNLDITNSTSAVFAINKEFSKEKGESIPKSIEECWSNDVTKSKEVKKCMSEVLKSRFKENGWLWGAEIKGGIKDGLGTLFSGEKVASAASIGGLIGWKKSWTSIKCGGIDKIYEAFQGGEQSERISSIKAEITKELLETVLNQTGAKKSLLEIDTTKIKPNRYVRFYEGAIQTLDLFKGQELTNLETKSKHLEKITSLEVAIDEGLKKVKIYSEWKSHIDNLPTLKEQLSVETNAAKKAQISKQISAIEKNINANERQYVTLEKLRNDIYKDCFLITEQKIEIVYPDYSFTEPFDKANWEKASEKVKRDIEKTTTEVNYLKTVSTKTETKEIKKLKEIFNKLIVEYKSQEDKGNTQKINTTIAKNTSLNSFLLYLRPTVKGDAYKYDLANDSTLVADRFVDRTFNGYTIELGSTYNFKRYNYIGLSTSVNYTNNISALTTTTYKLEKQDTTITDGEFTTSEEIKALSGTFDSYMRYDLNFDYVYLMPMKESAESEKTSAIYLSVNPYLRHRIYDKSDKLKNNTILGLGLHAYNSNDNRLMGGLFVQTTDLFGNHAGDDSTLGKRIVFGIIAKYSITGLKVEKKVN